MALRGAFHAEIERKFLLSGLPPVLHGRASLHMSQGYLVGGLRLRRIVDEEAERHVLTEKRGEGIARREREETISRLRFEALWPGTAGRRLEKRRWRVPEGGRVWEVDGFLDRDLVLAEIELASEHEPVETPAWLAPHVVREVSLEPGFRNSALAR